MPPEATGPDETTVVTEIMYLAENTGVKAEDENLTDPQVTDDPE